MSYTDPDKKRNCAEDVLKKIIHYRLTYDRIPNTREIQKMLKAKSPRSVTQYLNALEERGYIIRGVGARNIQILYQRLPIEIKNFVVSKMRELLKELEK